MNKIILGIVIAAILLAGIFTIRFFLDEDDWICKDGVWIKHGNPSNTIPEKNCGEFWFEEAKKLAQEEAEGINVSLTGNYEYNDYTNTVWFEIKDSYSIKEGCNPASIVNLINGETEINWRCTGLVNTE